MAGLPAAMQAKKVKIAETHLEPIAVVKRPVPVVVHTATEQKPPEKKVDETPTVNESEFAVGADDEDTSTSTTVVELKPEIKPEVKVEVKPEEDAANWKWMYKSLEGNHQIALNENRELRDKIVELDTKLNLFVEKQTTTVKAAEVTANDLTAEELEQYSDALPVLNKLLAKQQRNIEESVVKPLQIEISELRKNTSAIADKTAATDEGSFMQQVKLQVKDFDTILKSPAWADFTKQPLSSYTDETIGQALLKAHTKRDLTKIVKVFEDFTKSKPAVSAADAYRGPSVSNAAGALPDNSSKPILKWSKRKEASEKFRKRQISPAEFEKISEMYRVADAEGRIDFNK